MTASSTSTAAGMWYCYAINDSLATPEKINKLWTDRHPDRWARAFHVGDGYDDAVRHHLQTDPAGWWLRYGAGHTVIRGGQHRLDTAVYRFLLDHAELFSKMWYGTVGKSPLDSPAWAPGTPQIGSLGGEHA